MNPILSKKITLKVGSQAWMVELAVCLCYWRDMEIYFGKEKLSKLILGDTSLPVEYRSVVVGK